MLASTMLLLAGDTDTLGHIRRDRAVIRPLLEESLRLESPIQWLQRVVTHDVELGGVIIPAGSLVLILWGSANRDERQFEDPDALRLDRSRATRHLAFGVGIHMCVGAPLARLEGEIAFNRLLDRRPDPRLVEPEPISHIPNVNQRAPSTVRVEWPAA
jgi:cytochrome P450